MKGGKRMKIIIGLLVFAVCAAYALAMGAAAGDADRCQPRPPGCGRDNRTGRDAE